jgi:hypothetical protein
MMKHLRTPVRDLSKTELYEDFYNNLAATAAGTVTSGGESGATASVTLVSPLWATVLTDSGTATVGDAANGILSLEASDGSAADNDEAYIRSTKEIFLFANNKPLVLEGMVQFTEANTDDANVAFGATDAVAADTIVNDGGGPKTSGSGLYIYKVDGSNVWKCSAICNGSSAGVITTSVTAGGASYQKLRIEFKPYSSTQANVAYFVDDVHVGSLQLTYSSATEMALFAGVKNGFTNKETLKVDYLYGSQLR